MADEWSMRSRGLAGSASSNPGIEPDIDIAIVEKDQENRASDPSRPMLFRERRRSRPIAEWRHEALESLDRLLTRYEKTHEELREAEQKYRTLFEEAMIGMFQVSRAGRPLCINGAMARIYGYDSPGQLLTEITNLRELFVDANQLEIWSDSLFETGAKYGIEAEIRCRDGAKKWVLLNLRSVRDESGRIAHYEGTGEDITERKRDEARIQTLAYYDSLTGLPNRTLFRERLDDAIKDAHRKNGQGAVLIFEIDRFKIMNDSLGHAFGDCLLQELAARIEAVAAQRGLVARGEGCEFLLMLPEINDATESETVAHSVVATLNAEFSALGHSLNIGCHVGISLFPDDGTDCDLLLKNADVAMYSAKENGPNRVRLFTPAMNVQIMERLNLENGLGLALDRNELFLVYQPQVNISTGTITGLEALLRWQHPQWGLVPPSRFIEVAENSGSIVRIGEWVLRTACLQAKKWQDAGLLAVPVAVNVSAVQFRKQGFSELIRSVLGDTGLDPKYLELELTESLLLTNADVMFTILQDLREMGVKLAIDDFGTGYSSLGYLRQFQVNRLKIDRSFVRDVAVNPDDAAITTAIIRMAKALNLEVLAEGVENKAQLSFLLAQHCYEVQGYYFSRPVAVDQMVEILRGSSIQPASPDLIN